MIIRLLLGVIRAIFYVAAGLLVFIIIQGSINVSGFCVKEARFLRKEEQLNIAVEYFFIKYYKSDSPNLQPIKNREYGDAKDFIRLNPGCCDLRREPPDMDSYFGNKAAVATIYFPLDGKETFSKRSRESFHISEYDKAFIRVSNCGIPSEYP